MSGDATEIVGRMYEAFNREGVPGTIGFYDEEIEWHSDPRFPGGGVHKGPDQVGAYMKSLIDNWHRVQLRVEELIVHRDRVLAILTLVSEGRDGLELEMFWGHLWTVRSGRMREVRSFLDRDAALEALKG